MSKRLDLHQVLVNILGSQNVYYQPPESISISYPAIIYELSKIDNKNADNAVYNQSTYYQISVVRDSHDIDTTQKFVEEISRIPTARHVRHYTSRNLYYDVFTILY